MAMDNVELVGPPYEGEYQEPNYTISASFPEVPVPLSFLGNGAIDALLTITAFIYLVASLLCAIFYKGYFIQKAVVYSWVGRFMQKWIGLVIELL